MRNENGNFIRAAGKYSLHTYKQIQLTLFCKNICSLHGKYQFLQIVQIKSNALEWFLLVFFLNYITFECITDHYYNTDSE